MWTESGAQIDEVVANSRTVPPASVVQPLYANIPFSNLRYPHVDAQENVTFIADDPAYSSKVHHHGIYRSLSRTEELRSLVRAGESFVPGTTARFQFIRGLQVDGADFVFNATDAEHGRGLYFWSNGSVQTIARSRTTTLPGVGRALTDVEYGALSNGRVLYNARAGNENLLVLHELKTGQVRVLCRSGVDIPQRTGEKFKYFSPQNWLDPANIIFRGANVEDPHAERLQNEGHRGIYGWFGIDWRQKEKTLETARLTTLADATTRVPGLHEEVRYIDFRSAPIRDGMVGFVATAMRAPNSTLSGVYYCDISGADRQVRPIVDTETSLAGLFPGPFTRFGIYCSVFDKSVVFVGYGEKDYVGVFLYRIDRDELFLMCDNRTAVENKHVIDFEIAGDFLVRNRFAVTAQLNDGSYGVYLATIPPWSFKRMKSGANH